MRTPTWVLGYHGCDREVGEAVLAGQTVLRPSANEWDWLGTGVYFWENSARRALDWANFAQANPQFFSMAVHRPFVVGAIIDLGNCLDLLEAESIRLVKESYLELQQVFLATGAPMPVNAGHSPDRVVRRLDCAVINYVHDLRERQRQTAFDSVRAAFFEGDRLYSEAGFRDRTHIQLCVRNESQIIGYFRVRDLHLERARSLSKPLPVRRRAVRRKPD